MNSYIIIGSKSYTNLRLDDVIDVFDKNLRFNLSLPGNNNGTKLYDHALCPHMYDNFVKKKIKKTNLPVEYIKTFDKDCMHSFIDNFDIKKFHNVIKVVPAFEKYNNFLKKISCPHRFTKPLNSGYMCLLDKLITKQEEKIFVHGFSISSYVPSYYCTDPKAAYRCHDPNSQMKILIWLHNNNFVDASMCALEDTEIPTFNYTNITPSPYIKNLFTKMFGN